MKYQQDHLPRQIHQGREKRSSLAGIVALCTILLLCPWTGSAQSVFQHLYSSDFFVFKRDDRGYAVHPTEDCGYILAGSTLLGFAVVADRPQGSPGDGDHIFLVKVDEHGDTIWSRVANDLQGGNIAYDVEVASDGGYVVVGSSQRDSIIYDVYGHPQTLVLSRSVLIMKFTGNGTALWLQRYAAGPKNSKITARSIRETHDQGFIIAGEITWPNNPHSHMFLMKTDIDGNMLWRKVYGAQTGYTAHAAQPTFDGGYVVVGHDFNLHGKVVLLKTNGSGNHQWSKSYDGGPNTQAQGHDILETAKGNFLLTGSIKSALSTTGGTVGGIRNIYLLRLNGNGGLIWSKRLAADEPTREVYGRSLQETCDGTIIVGGTTEQLTTDGQDLDAVLAAFNQAGALQWSRAYGDPALQENGETVAINNLKDGFTLFGTAYSPAALARNMYLLKTDQGGTTGCQEAELVLQNEGPNTVVNTLPLTTKPIDIVDDCKPSDEGCRSYILKGVRKSERCREIFAPVETTFGLETEKAGLTVQFFPTLPDDQCLLDEISFTWNFGDGGQATGQNPTHTFTTEGLQTVCFGVSHPCFQTNICHEVLVYNDDCSCIE